MSKQTTTRRPRRRTNGGPHTIRLEQDPNRQRLRAVCDLHGWESAWCAAGPGHPVDGGWTPSPALVARTTDLGAGHLRDANPRRVLT